MGKIQVKDRGAVMADTVAAVASGQGACGIGVIRVSGPDAFEIVSKAFVPAGSKKLSDVQAREILYGHIVDAEEKTLDEVLLLVMRAPHTYTGEDTVEIDCHGGLYILRAVLERLIEVGARAAEPGEFTKRAFMNGKIDLSQAEAVMDMIGAKGKAALQAASRRLEGHLGAQISDLRQKLMDLLVLLEVQIDYPEYEIDEAQELDEKEVIDDVLAKLEALYATADTGRMLVGGAKVVLAGKPNMGKSTLLNALLRENRAIVTEIPGTTRDTIEAEMDLNGVPIRLIDTAGLRETEDRIEQEGVARAKEALDSADLVLYLAQAGEKLSESDKKELSLLVGKPHFLVWTKGDACDFSAACEASAEAETFDTEAKKFFISASRGDGMESLKQAILAFVLSGSKEATDGVFLANARQKQAVLDAIDALKRAKEVTAIGLGSDMTSTEVSRACQALYELTGDTASETLVDTIFSRFCLGK